MDDWLSVLIITGTIIVILVISLISIISERLDRNSYRDHIKEAVVGDYKSSAHTEDFHYWLICDGRSLNRHVYCRLFDVIGTTFGSADAESFNLPDARGRVPGFAGQGVGLSLRTAGQFFGNETHTLTVAELAEHSHGVTDPGHFHTFTTINDDFNGNGGNDNGFSRDAIPNPQQNNSNIRSWNTNSKTTDISINDEGDSDPFSIMQPTLIIGNLFIYGGEVHHHHHHHPHPTPTPTPAPTPM